MLKHLLTAIKMKIFDEDTILVILFILSLLFLSFSTSIKL